MTSWWQEMQRASKADRDEFAEFAAESWDVCVVNNGMNWLAWLYWILPVWWGYSGKTPVWFL